MKGHEISITFLRKTWDQTCLVFMLSALKRTTAKTYFLHYDIWVKLYRFYHTCYFTRTFPHSYAASFSMKTCFYKINIFCLRTKQIYSKTLPFSKKKIRNKTNVFFETFRNFVYVNSYLKIKIFAPKWVRAISSKLQIPRC